MQRILCAALLALAAGCNTLGEEPVPGWPALEVVEHYVPHAAMRERCARYVGFGMSPEACAEFDFERRRCHIWYSADFPPPPYLRSHERRHCAGYDHVGSTAMQQSLQRYLAIRAEEQSAAAGASR